MKTLRSKFHSWVLGFNFVEAIVNATYVEAFGIGRMDGIRYCGEVLQAGKDAIEEKARDLAEETMASLLSVVDPKSIVKYDKSMRIIFIGDERADDGRLSNLKAEAEFFQQSDLWKLLYHTPSELAQKAMFVSGESLVDMQKGKSMLFTLSTQKNILDTFLSYTPKG